jgi:hypothetical protein
VADTQQPHVHPRPHAIPSLTGYLVRAGISPGPAELGELVGEVKALRANSGAGAEPYDVVIEADSSGELIQLQPPEPKAWEEAGATWWIESWWSIDPGSEGLAEVRRRVQAGPPSGD